MGRAFDLPHGVRTGILIDGPHLWAAARSLGFTIDFQKLIDEVRAEAQLVEAIFVTPVREDPEHDPMRPLMEWMRDADYTVHTKPLATFTDERGRVRHDGRCSVEVAVDLMSLADRTEHVILFCGDANLGTAVRAARKRGAAVTIVSTVSSGTATASAEIRAAADRFLDIADLRDHLERAFPGRQEPRERVPTVGEEGIPLFQPRQPTELSRGRRGAGRRARSTHNR